MRQLKTKSQIGHGGASVAKKKSAGGRKRQITLDVVKRVSERFALGMPLKAALARETNACINENSWYAALRRNPEFVQVFEREKAQYSEQMLRWFAFHDDWRARLVVLERRNPDLWAKPVERVDVSSTIAGLPDDYLAILRDHAQKRNTV